MLITLKEVFLLVWLCTGNIITFCKFNADTNFIRCSTQQFLPRKHSPANFSFHNQAPTKYQGTHPGVKLSLDVKGFEFNVLAHSLISSSPYQEKTLRHTPHPDKSSLKDQSYKRRAQTLLPFVTTLKVPLAPQSKPGTSSMISRIWPTQCQNTACIQAPVTLNGGHYHHLPPFFDSWLLFSECQIEPTKFY